MTNLKLTNANDLMNARGGLIARDAVRHVEVEALVDTGATVLALPEEIVERLGVDLGNKRKARDAMGNMIEVGWAMGLYIEILGREMTCDALVLARGATPLIGQIQLEALDLIVDPKTREVRVNPASPDTPLLDLMAVA
jgi:clan AA aspartic protease